MEEQAIAGSILRWNLGRTESQELSAENIKARPFSDYQIKASHKNRGISDCLTIENTGLHMVIRAWEQMKSSRAEYTKCIQGPLTHQSEEEEPMIVNEVERPGRQRESAAPGHRSQGRMGRDYCVECCSKIRSLVTSKARQQLQGKEGSKEETNQKPSLQPPISRNVCQRGANIWSRWAIFPFL